jgi:hypothetical protein
LAFHGVEALEKVANIACELRLVALIDKFRKMTNSHL